MGRLVNSENKIYPLEVLALTDMPLKETQNDLGTQETTF